MNGPCNFKLPPLREDHLEQSLRDFQDLRIWAQAADPRATTPLPPLVRPLQTPQDAADLVAQLRALHESLVEGQVQFCALSAQAEDLLRQSLLPHSTVEQFRSQAAALLGLAEGAQIRWDSRCCALGPLLQQDHPEPRILQHLVLHLLAAGYDNMLWGWIALGMATYKKFLHMETGQPHPDLAHLEAIQLLLPPQADRLAQYFAALVPQTAPSMDSP